MFDDEHGILPARHSGIFEKHSVARLIGAPPGYGSGIEEAARFTEAVSPAAPISRLNPV